MSYRYIRHGEVHVVKYEDVLPLVEENLRTRTLFPTTISVSLMAGYVCARLELERNERYWKLYKFVDFAIRELAETKPASIGGEEINNNNRNYKKHVYLVLGLKESTTDS